MKDLKVSNLCNENVFIECHQFFDRQSSAFTHIPCLWMLSNNLLLLGKCGQHEPFFCKYYVSYWSLSNKYVALQKPVLAFALLHSVLEGQICLLLQVSLDFLFSIPVPCNDKDMLFGC